VARLQQQVETLQARLRAREDLAAARQAAASDRPGSNVTNEERLAAQGLVRTSRPEPSATSPGQTDAGSAPARAKAPVTASVQGALDRFYKYLEATNETSGRPRWREARELVEELRAMGAPAGQALMQVLASGNDSDERRAAARLLGQLQIAQALPLLKDIVDRDQDLLTRRAAASGLRQLQTPESLPVLERILAQPSEDRFIRLSAAAGLASSGKAQGVTGLTHIFDEAAGDGRGREMAFRALSNLKDERPVPFMRQLLTAQVEPAYRLQAIRYLAAQGDQQSLATLHVLMTSPSEQPSIRDAAAQAHATIRSR
jgi:HEAT repeat protein